MKKILITANNSYIGNNLKEYLEKKFENKYLIEKISLRTERWRHQSFKTYDSIIHVAGIAHSDNGHISEDKSKLYYKINADLTVEVAKKAIVDGAKQFIFISSAIVYGESGHIGEKKIITKDTIPAPINAYGDSKLQAEIGIARLVKDINLNTKNVKYENDSSHFTKNTSELNNIYKQLKNTKIAILRIPMVYGKNSKGNYRILERLANKLPVFPYVKNERSMISIDNLCKYMKKIIDDENAGLFFPQDEYYHNTSEMVKEIAKANGRNMILIPGFQWMIKIASLFLPMLNKAFGNLTYERNL